MTPLPDYARHLLSRRDSLAACARTHARFSYARLALAAAAVAIPLWGGLAAAVWVLVPVAGFLVTAYFHARLLNRQDRARSAVAFYERCLARVEGRWAGHGRTGDRFRPPDHPYAEDLDLFGRGTLFDLLATVRTDDGEAVLARWLLAPAGPDVVRARQAAVAELASRLDLREAIAVAGDVVRQRVDASMLRTWAALPRRFRGSAPRLIAAAAVVGSALAIVWWIATGRGEYAVLAAFALQGLVAHWFRTMVHAVVHDVDEPSRELDVLASLLTLLERESFTSPLLRRLQADVGGGTRPASAEIARLSQWVALLSSRENLLFALPAALVLWTSQWAFAIEAWRARAGSHLTRWLDAVGEFEALLALSAFAAEHPDYAVPEFVEGPARLVAVEVAHPVLRGDAVANDVTLGGDAARLLIVSGSNMSGKSTLLRTLGVNVVLAQAGAPVRAAAFTLSPLEVGASISVHDSLADGRSRFFAEIRRLKYIVDRVRAREGHVLFLLDEIFGGTNSHDRRIGAEAVLSGLVGHGAIGLATTHDLALAEIVDRIGHAAANVHFEDRFAEGVLSFDYRIKPGLVRTSNAIALMRSVGLEV